VEREAPTFGHSRKYRQQCWERLMQLGRVVGTATATVKHPTFDGERMLVVQVEAPGGKPDGEPILAFDRLGAGHGALVLVTNDGRALQELLGPTTPGRWSVLGLPDQDAGTGRIGR
jgi:ethanolamine utilization protein EutN